jgi:hypothetical protein
MDLLLRKSINQLIGLDIVEWSKQSDVVGDFSVVDASDGVVFSFWMELVEFCFERG